MEFDLKESEFIPLCDLLKVTGHCENGGHAKSVIADGEVKVNGETCTVKRLKIKSNDVIEFSGQQIKVL
jgi:ribosome-associated protein